MCLSIALCLHTIFIFYTTPLLYNQLCAVHFVLKRFYMLLILAPWVFLWAYPFLQIGIWFDVEGIGIALCFLTSLICFQFCFKKAYSYSHSWLFVALFTLGFLAITSSLLSSHQDLSWFGHPETMIGAWTWCSFALLYGVLFFSKDNQTNRKALFLSTATACFTIGFVTIISHQSFLHLIEGYHLYHFTSYLAWPGLTLIYLADKLPKKYIWILLGLCFVLISNNKTAYLGLCLGTVLGTLHHFFPSKENFLKTIYLCLPLLFTLSIYLFCQSSFFEDIRQNYADPSNIHNFLESLYSRYLSLKLLLIDLYRSHWWQWIIGHGFGQMSDVIIRNLFFTQETVYLNGIYDPSWEGIGRFDSSSLNQFLDMLHAGGFIASGIYLYLHLVLLKNKSFFHWVSSTILLCLSTTWFLMVFFIPILLSLLIATESHKTKTIVTLHKTAFKNVLRAISCTFGIIFLYSSFSMSLTASFYSQDLESITANLFPAKSINKESLFKAKGPASIHFSFWLRSVLHNQATYDAEMGYALITDIYKHSTPSLVLAEQIGELSKLTNQPIEPLVVKHVFKSAPERLDLLWFCLFFPSTKTMLFSIIKNLPAQTTRVNQSLKDFYQGFYREYIPNYLPKITYSTDE